MRAVLVLVVTGAALAGCAPPGGQVPPEFTERREAELQGGPIVLPPPRDPFAAAETEAERLARETREALAGGPPPAPGSVPQVGGSSIAAGTLAPSAPGLPPPAFPPNPVEAPIGAEAPVAVGAAGISLEQDFGAVASQRSIEDDAQRLEAARAQRVEVQPRALERPTDVGANVISYAVDQARPRGEAGAFARGAFASQRRAEGRCQGYRSSDAAQQAFLEAGGPQTDRLGLDPDGDGNACGWDPAAYRGLVGR